MGKGKKYKSEDLGQLPKDKAGVIGGNNYIINTDNINRTTFKQPEYSNWRCYLFGMGNTTLRPFKGQGPNWFWRWMQYLCFGNKWVKDKEEK